MNTTDLFVELVVIGVGAAAWVVLLVLAVFGYDWVPADKALSLPAAIPGLAAIYLLGIITDCIADSLFGDLWATQSRDKVYGTPEPRSTPDHQHPYYDDKLLVLMESRLASLFEYSKSRQRICRGWCLNALALLIATNLFLWIQDDRDLGTLGVSVFVTVIFVTLATTSWYTWRRLNETQYRKVREQAQNLRLRVVPGDGA